MKKDITNLFCFIDDFSNECKKEMDKRSISGCTKINPTRVPGLSESEIITIIEFFRNYAICFIVSLIQGIIFFAMKYAQVNFLSEEQFRRLTGIKSATFDKMVRILSEADNKKKAKGGRKNKLSIENQLLMAL